MFNKALLSGDRRMLDVDAPPVILPSDVILYLPLTSNVNDSGYYAMPSTQYVAGYPPILTNGWMRFSASGGNTYGGEYQAGLVFNHPIFSTITNSDSDFTIEFNIRVQINTTTSSNIGIALKVFPFSFVGAATGSSTVHQVGEQMELGMTLGSHQAPGGFGFGVGSAGSTSGVAAICTSDDSSPDSYVNRGIAVIPNTNTAADVWGPYSMAIVRKNGVVTFFVNGMKIHTVFAADDTGSGVNNPNLSWTWSTFGLNTQSAGASIGPYGDGTISNPNSSSDGYPINYGGSGANPVTAKNGLFVGCCYTYSNFGFDDHLFLQHFRITTKARYTQDYVPEAIYANPTYPA